MDWVVDWLAPVLVIGCAAVVALWMAGAIYFDACGGAKWGGVVAATWVVGVVALFVLWRPIWHPFLALLAVAAAFIAWWLRQKPSHNREWEPEVAVLPRAIRDGDAVTIENVRNFHYRTLEDFTPRYESRAFHLSHLKGADIIFFNWGSALMSHPVLVFDFGPDGRICFSIEVRYRKGQKFSILRSLYRQQELMFVALDERDAILRRTKYGEPQEAHLYFLKAPLEDLRTAFLDYVGAINDLFETPRWYHGVCANCTTSYFRLPGSRRRCDWRVLANAKLDQALYDAGRLDRSLPFPELRRIAYLNDIANSAPEDGFGDHIRRELERRRNEQ